MGNYRGPGRPKADPAARLGMRFTVRLNKGVARMLIHMAKAEGITHCAAMRGIVQAYFREEHRGRKG